MDSSVDIAETVGRSEYRTVNGVRLHTIVAGNAENPLVVLLHGFPECWLTWHRHIEPLVDAGYRVLVPDQRGYNRSDSPRRVRAYRTSELSTDIAELIASESRESAHVVGHDWGGVVAWDLALRRPAVVDRLVVVNAPHPTAYREHLLANPDQLRRSWYAAVFQLPRLPEYVCRLGDFRLLKGALRGQTGPETIPDELLERYKHAWSRDGVLSGMLHWYRAAFRYPPTYDRNRISPPTLVLWGVSDPALSRWLAVESYHHCVEGSLEFVSAGHWVPHELPDRTTVSIRRHFTTETN